jgi:hypothetical protein
MTLSRRSLITGLISLVAAPAIVRVSRLMPVKAEPKLTIEQLLRLRIADAERVMLEHVKTVIFGNHVFGISGTSNNIYYEPLKLNGVDIHFDKYAPDGTVYLLPERR